MKTINQIKEFLEQVEVMSEPDKWAKEKEAYANGAKIQFKGTYAADDWIYVCNPSWTEGLTYRIDPTWVTEQGAKLYAWDVGYKSQWFRAMEYRTKCEIETEYPKSKGYRHVRGAEFVVPKDEE